MITEILFATLSPSPYLLLSISFANTLPQNFPMMVISSYTCIDTLKCGFSRSWGRNLQTVFRRNGFGSRFMSSKGVETLPELGSEAHMLLQQSMPGTAQAHRCHVFLRSHIPPKEFTPKYMTPIQRALLLRLIQLGVVVNSAWYPDLEPKGNSDPTHITKKQSAVAFSSLGGRLDIPEITLANIDEVEALLKSHMEGSIQAPLIREEIKGQVFVYVCTHGSRDCRCGDMGGLVVEALRQEVQRRQDAGDAHICVGEVGHVGGHKYAANVLVYPQGEWLGLVRPEHAPEIIAAALSSPLRPLTSTDPLMLKQHWRGRMGFGKDEQLDLYRGEEGQR